MKTAITTLIKEVLLTKGFVETRQGNMVLSIQHNVVKRTDFQFRFNQDSVIIEQRVNSGDFKRLGKCLYSNVKFISNGFILNGHVFRKGKE